MVEAILAGRKTQTRRILKSDAKIIRWSPVVLNGHGGFIDEHGRPIKLRHGVTGDQLWVRETYYAYGRWETRFNQKKGRDEWHFVDLTRDFGPYRYADNPPETTEKVRGGTGWYKRPSLFMPRDASRILLEVENNRIERLQDISEADAIAEGIYCYGEPAPGLFLYKNYTVPESEDVGIIEAVSSYETLWQSINGPESWSNNDYVTATSFRRI